MPGICLRGAEGVSGKFLPIRHMPGIFLAHLQNLLSPEPDPNLGKSPYSPTNRHMPGICLKTGQTASMVGQLGIYGAFMGHFLHICDLGHLWGIYGAFLTLRAIFGGLRHMPGIFLSHWALFGTSRHFPGIFTTDHVSEAFPGHFCIFPSRHLHNST